MEHFLFLKYTKAKLGEEKRPVKNRQLMANQNAPAGKASIQIPAG